MTYFTPQHFSYIGSNFKSWFGSMPSKPVKRKLYSFDLPKSMNDEKILKTYAPAECTLNDIAYLLKENTQLLTNGYANIFYVKDKDNILRAVRVFWSAIFRDWDVDADEVASPYEWRGGDRFFSRNLLSFKEKDNVIEVPLSLEINGFTYKREL